MKRAVLIALCVAGCAGPAGDVKGPVDPMPPEESGGDAGVDAAPQVAPAPKLPDLEKVTVMVVAAEVKAKMKDGRSWDEGESTLLRPVQKPFLKYLKSHPALRATSSHIGVPLDKPDMIRDAGRDAAPDPMIYIEVGDHIFRSPARPRAFAPLWDFPFTFAFGFSTTKMGTMPGDLVRIHVVDFDAGGGFDIMGSTILSVEQLLKKPLHRLGPFGSVSSLTLQVKRNPLDEAAKPRSKSLDVPGRPSWTNTGIEVVAGQRLRIDAADEVCTTREGLEKCSGPEGQRSRSDKNLTGFKDVGHGALVGSIGDTRFVIGRRLELIAPSSGPLLLGVNDRDTRNNRGSYAVRVWAYPLPVLTVKRPAN